MKWLFNVQNLSKGKYVCRIHAGDIVATKKPVLLKMSAQMHRRREAPAAMSASRR
jgi:hypothetical protein